MTDPVPARVQAAEQRRDFRGLLSCGSLGCPRPISCGHMLVDHGDGWDYQGQPTNPTCRVSGCDCDGVS